MLIKLFGIVIMRKRNLDKLFAEAVDKASYNSYRLGYQMGKREKTDKGFVIGSTIDQQISEIQQRKGGE